MNVIISHDVDHITAWEHLGRDLILPKHIVRNCIEFGLKHISLGETARRCGDIIKNRWNNIADLMKFDRGRGVPSTFFFGVQNGLGLSYTPDDAKLWMNRVAREGFSIGVHGIAFELPEEIRREHDAFAAATGLDGFGIRMHYLRRNPETLANLEKTGYKFDSTLPELTPPFKVGGMWEFPLHIMDGDILCGNGRWQDRTLEQAKDSTKAILEASADRGIEYFTILLHDRYFSDSFRTWKEWYVWVTEFLKESGCRFVSYDGAIGELERAHAVL
ncbi:MAG: hypothetical protein M0Z58_03260 [Nitrospiraceae bacterium]|nr:hypothetical protein [Nitrospiraceae bacterium]